MRSITPLIIITLLINSYSFQINRNRYANVYKNIECNDRIPFRVKLLATLEKHPKLAPEGDTDKEKEGLKSKLLKAIGTVDEDRIPIEVRTGELTRMFSNIQYKKNESGDWLIANNSEGLNNYSGMTSAMESVEIVHAPGSTVGATALVAGTTIGAGILALPATTAPVGFIGSSAALCLGWLYMCISGLLVAELTMNQISRTGRTGVGLLEIQREYLGETGSKLGAAAYLFLHYAVMIAYVAGGGANLGSVFHSVDIFRNLESVPHLDQILFTALVGGSVYVLNSKTMEKINNALVLGVMSTFVGLLSLGISSADLSTLIRPENQNPAGVLDTFPIIFLSLVYQNVVPTVVNQLEGDRKKIQTAIITGSFIPLLMFVAWNAIILGNVLPNPDIAQQVIAGDLDPVAVLQGGGGSNALLSNLVGSFSALAITTSLIGFTYGLLDALTDLFNIPSDGPEFEKWKPALFAGVLVPPLAFSMANPDIFLQALDYGGAFGVSTLFLILPPIMVWSLRYGDQESKLATRPMVPFGKIPLGSLWKAAGTLVIEQGLEKLGVFEFISENWHELTDKI